MLRDEFDKRVAPFRRELAAHCYRMLGSVADAEDQVQETLLRAWRGIDGFQGNASMRTWLYRIATNACIDALRRRPSRTLPTEVGEPSDPHAPLPPPPDEPVWVQPCPPALWEATPQTPEASYSARESVRLAFVVALQHLPAKQRSVLLLFDVLGWSAAEIAELLDSSVASVNSALQRARSTLGASRLRNASASADDPAVRAMLSRYLQAWESGDAHALTELLHEDVITSMPPLPIWLRGREALIAFIEARVGAPGALRAMPFQCADDAGFAFYRRGDDGVHRAECLQVLRLDGARVIELHAFLYPDLFPHFDLPMQIDR